MYTSRPLFAALACSFSLAACDPPPEGATIKGVPLETAQKAISEDRGARATEVVLANRTARTLSFNSGSASHGIWSTSVPGAIAPHTYGRWETESNGFATGTEAWIKYLVPSAGMLYLHWSNPFVGSNSYDSTAPGGFVIDRIGGEQNRATVFFLLRDAGTPFTSCPWESANWILDNMIKNSEVGSGLTWLDQAVAIFTTPVFKETDLAGGWGTTGCRTNDGEGIVVHDGQHSTDGYYTIDVRLTKTWGLTFPAPSSEGKYLRLEVGPGKAAHDTIDRVGVPRKGMKISFAGPYLIDHGAFIENHPDTFISYHF